MSTRSRRGKQQLQHWLWQMVDSKSCPGVRWVSKTDRIFQIPWVNQKTSEWKEEFSQLFTEYAKHTGKLPLGGTIDHPKFKQNFKSAIEKNKVVKCICKERNSCRRYMFTKDCSSFNEREDGNPRQTRNIQSSNDGVGFIWNGISVDEKEGDVFTSQASTEQPYLAQPENGGELTTIHFLHDENVNLLNSSETNVFNTFDNGLLQQDSNLRDLERESGLPGEENTAVEMVDTLLLSTFMENPNVESSQIQNTTVDSTTGVLNVNSSSSIEFTDDGQNLSETLLSRYYDVHQGADGGEISTQLTNNNMSIAGCTRTVHTNNNSTLSMYSQWRDPGHKTTSCKNFGYANTTSEVQENQFVVSMKAAPGQSSLNSSSSMQTSEEENNRNQAEAALSACVSSSTAPATAGAQALISASPSVEIPKLMIIQIIYAMPQRVVRTEIITSNKCKIFFGRVQNKRLQEQIEKRDDGVVLVELPAVKDCDFNAENKSRIDTTLERMELGVVICYRDDNIYVVRRCQSRAFLSDGVSTSESLPRSRMKEGERDEEIKAFDFESFKNSIDCHKQKTGSINRDYFVLTLGCEILKNDPSPTRVVPVRVDVHHAKATSMRFDELGPAAFSPDPQHSISDSFDNEIHLSNLRLSF